MRIACKMSMPPAGSTSSMLSRLDESEPVDETSGSRSRPCREACRSGSSWRARCRPVAVALDGVDLAVVREEAERLRQPPLRPGVGREALVEHADSTAQRSIAQVRVEGRQHTRHDHALVGQTVPTTGWRRRTPRPRARARARPPPRDVQVGARRRGRPCRPGALTKTCSITAGIRGEKLPRRIRRIVHRHGFAAHRQPALGRPQLAKQQLALEESRATRWPRRSPRPG